MSCCLKSPKGVTGLMLRISFGLSLLLVGLNHYMTMEAFKGMATEGLGVLEPLGAIWALILPALMILGGALFVIGMYTEIAAWAAGLALASVPIGLLLKPIMSGVPLPGVLGQVIDSFIWLIVLVLVLNMGCFGSCKTEE